MTNQFEPQGVFYAADLPLTWTVLDRPQPMQTEQWQHDAVAFLKALAVIEAPVSDADRDTSTIAGKTAERLEAKLDLALSLMMQIARQQAELPEPLPVILRASSLEWDGPSAPEPGQKILLALHLSPKLPQAVHIPATVAVVEGLEHGSRIRADFDLLGQEMAEWLERTLFRFHRRSIQQSHSRLHGNS